MTLRERMRRRGWHWIKGLDWYQKNINGVDVLLWPHLDGQYFTEQSTIAIGAHYTTETVTYCGTEGIPSLAQRARALVRDRRTQ